MTAMTNASPDSSPVAGSSVASSSTVYRNLPAEKLFLGTGLENVTRRKPKRGSDSVIISGPLAGEEPLGFISSFVRRSDGGGVLGPRGHVPAGQRQPRNESIEMPTGFLCTPECCVGHEVIGEVRITVMTVLQSKVPGQRWRRCRALAEAGDRAYASLDMHGEMAGNHLGKDVMLRRQWYKIKKLPGTVRHYDYEAGLNHGIWFLSGTCGEVGSDYEELVLKLVRCHRIADNVPTEAENLVKVHREHSSISKDEILAFPIKIFSCFDGPTKKHDLIVMRKVPGERLAEVICRKFYNNQLALLDAIFENLGATLASFHERYGKQHGDG
ncbi:unnamed protein product [Symbiodinium sp. CCMP2456]|nr:unnamed protein product [Symbiodinium sp. CCMP2456]